MIKQIGFDNHGTDFSGNSASDRSASLYQLGNGNNGSIFQWGWHNVADVQQVGNNNSKGAVKQYGIKNIGRVEQYGNGNRAKVKQVGVLIMASLIKMVTTTVLI